MTSSARTALRRRTTLSFMPRRSHELANVSKPHSSSLPVPVAVVAVAAVDGLELLERAARPHCNTRERGLGAVGGHLRLVPQALVEPLEEQAAAGQHDAAVHDVGGQLG